MMSIILYNMLNQVIKLPCGRIQYRAVVPSKYNIIK